MSDPASPSAHARAALAQAQAQLCGHGVPRLNCAEHRQPSAESAPSEETDHA